MTNSTILSAIAKSRKKELINQEQLSRLTGAGKDVIYVPGETWRNNKMYMQDDSVKDSNGNQYIALNDSRNKPPTNNPDYWQKVAQSVIVKRWSDIPVGTEIEQNTEVIHNSKNWNCKQTHVKTAGNAPRVPSEFWEQM